MKSKQTRGMVEMTAAMMISGTIGWFVIRSGQPVIDLLFWRCVFGAVALLIVCALKGALSGTGSPAWTLALAPSRMRTVRLVGSPESL